MDDLVLLLVAAVPLAILWGRALLQIGRRRDLSTVHRVGWLAALFLLPVIGLAVYTILRPPPRPATTVGSVATGDAERVVIAAERLRRGELDVDGYRGELERSVVGP